MLPGQSIKLSTPKTKGAAAYQWYKDGQPIPGAISETYIISQPGSYTVRAFNKESCPSVLSDVIEVNLATKVDLVVTKKSETRQVRSGEPFDYLLTVKNKGPANATDVQLMDALPGELEYIGIKTATTGNFTYDEKLRVFTWSIGNLNLNEEVELRLSVKASAYGTVTNSAIVKSREEDANPIDNQSSDTKSIMGLDVPNVFTPNGDGKNDAFEIPELVGFPENEIIIVNRWGNSVYEKKNYRNDWTGEGLNEGTYFYILKVKTSRGTWDTYRGYVTLLRSKQE